MKIDVDVIGSGVVYPVNLKRKALIKIFLLQSSCAVRVKISEKLKFKAKNLTKGCILTIYLY